MVSYRKFVIIIGHLYIPLAGNTVFVNLRDVKRC